MSIVDTRMNAETYAQPATGLRRVVISAILRIGLIAGSLDIADNLIFNLFRGITPVMVFQYIASGLIGTQAITLGWVSTLLGVVLHYAIACTWTAVFYSVSRKFALLLRRPVLSGLLYGLVVYLFMNLIVLPISAVPRLRHPITLVSRINGVLAVMLCVGLTISLLVRRDSEQISPDNGSERRPEPRRRPG